MPLATQNIESMRRRVRAPLSVVTLLTMTSEGVTSPDDTPNIESNDATPLLFESDASSAAMVIALSDTVVSIPSPPLKVKVSSVLKVSLLPESAARVNEDAGLLNAKCRLY